MRTISYPFDANCPPPFELIQQFCEDMSAFLNADDRNVAVVHCCNGVQRTGIMVCSYLLHDNIFYSAKDALQFFATARTRNGVGIVIPSQQRYVQYYEHMVKKNFAYFRSVVLLESLKFIGNPCTQGSSCSPYFTIKIQKVKTYSSKDYDYIRRSGNITAFLLQQRLPLSGDVTIEFYHQSRISSKEKMFACCFNTSFVDMHLQSQQCKKRCKNRCKQTPKLHRPLSISFLDSADDDSAFEFNTSSNTPQNNSPLLTVSSHSVIKKCHSLTDVHAADDGIMIHEKHGLLSSSDSHGSEPRERTQSDFRFLYKKMMPHDRQLRRALKKAGRHAGVDITTGFTTVVHKPVKHNKTSQNTSQDVPPVMVSGPATSDERQAHNSNSASSSSGSFEESLDHRELVTIALPLSKLDHTAKSIRHISDDFQLHIVLSVDARVVKDLENDGCFDSDDSQDHCIRTHCTCGDDFAQVTAHSCFVKLMDRLIVNFPPNEGMHKKLTNMRNLTETLEPEFFQLMQQPDFLFCRRWFLLAFKREFAYNDIFRLWETMWAAEHLVTNCFMEFFALSLLRKYIATIMHRKMDTVEMLILFGEMESRQHNGEFESILRQTISLISQIKHNLTTE